ncbi:hypothetical protein AB3M83_07405 [Microbacterium sp. 179-B 1A2 NHS]|uniref:hypothetical protein n=1 Tax=Microbacterium sp. 179-B 1A2 NHS TaxID=3142383 RepID=UPI0039A2C01E
MRSRFLDRWNGRAADSESGAALVIVVAVGAVLAMFMSILVVTAVNGTKQAYTDADWNAALAAAYAGIDEYQSRLSEDTSYYRFGNGGSTFSAGSTVSTPLSPNPAFDVGTSGGWGTVPESGARAKFRYEVDNSKYATSGRIRLRATGKVGQATRTVIADLKQQGFIDFLYFTDYEVQDPSVAGTSSSSCFSDPLTKTTLKYSWSGRPTGSTCNEISFGAMDVTDGPVHSNDTIRACGSRFKSTVTTARATSPFYSNRDSNGSNCAAATFELAGYPAFSGGVIGMPATNSQLKKETRTDLTADDVPRPGCLYTGPTQFTFFADGTVNIKSPFTKMTRIGNAAATTGSAPAECGVIADLRSPAGATIAIPENNVLYVQNVPAVMNDVNYWASGTNPAGFTCITSGSSGKRGWSLGSGTAKTGYPVTTDWNGTTEVAPSSTTYGCRSGDVFVKGSFDGAATLAAENYVFVVGDITYVDDNEDILGLVGNNAIWVWNPLNNSGSNILGNNRTIEAAVLSVAHTFQVQNHDDGGSQGTLTVMGAIAQKYRGVVATTSGGSVSTGYAKNYVYDERFKFKAPPKFLNPITTTYGVTTWVETAAVWSSDGSAR